MSVAMSVCPSSLPCQVPAPRFQFPLDADGRIQCLFHDACVCAASPARARRVSRKLSRYAAYLSRVSVPAARAEARALDAARAQLYAQWQRAKRISLIHAPTPENVAARRALVGPFRAAHAQCVEADAAHAQCVEAVAKVRARVRAIAALRARA